MIFKKICLVTANRSDYAKIRFLVKSINKDKDIELSVIVAGTHASYKYGNSIDDIIEDGSFISDSISCSLDSDTKESMIKSSALEIYELTNSISKIKPDAGIVVGDRFDILPAVYVFSLLNIPIIHIQGGEKTGTIDDVIRNVITKFAHIHMVANEDAKSSVIGMGEDSIHVYNVGCPSIDYIRSISIPDYIDMGSLLKYCKDPIDLNKEDDYFICIVHPNTSIPEDIDIDEIIAALDSFKNKKIFFYPNNDPFNNKIVNRISKRSDYIKFKHLPMDLFMMLLKNCKCMIGNSSCGIRESSLFGIPTINIGERQHGRLRSHNIMDVACQREEIKMAIKDMMNRRFSPMSLYGDGFSSNRIIKIIKSYDKISYKNVNI